MKSGLSYPQRQFLGTPVPPKYIGSKNDPKLNFPDTTSGSSNVAPGISGASECPSSHWHQVIDRTNKDRSIERTKIDRPKPIPQWQFINANNDLGNLELYCDLN
jgi:hypothetical protein